MPAGNVSQKTAVKLKIHYPKLKRSVIPYCSYKNFDNARFMENLNSEIFTQSTSLTKDTLNTF